MLHAVHGLCFRKRLNDLSHQHEVANVTLTPWEIKNKYADGTDFDYRNLLRPGHDGMACMIAKY